MNNIFRFFTFALMAGSLVSCQDFLDKPQPSTSLPSSSAFQTAADLETGVIGAYNAAQLSDMFACNTTMIPDLLSNNGDWRGSFPSYSDIYQLLMTADNAETQGMWRDGYRLINQANLILDFLPKVEDPELTPELRDQLEGEALFLRGAAYFELVRFYGQEPWGTGNEASALGIPILSTPTFAFGDVTFPARGTVQEAYDQAIADLERAGNLLPDVVGPGRANRFAAIGYLAEIAFQQGRYGDAATLSKLIIDEGGFMLNPEANGFFINEGSPEEIWVIINTVQDNPGVNGSLPTFHHVNGRGGDVVVNTELIEDGYDQILTDAQKSAIANAGFTADDQRVSLLTSNDTFNIEKYEDFTNNADDAPIQRYVEYLLMYAEAEARSSNSVTQEVVDILNQVRTRSLRVLDGNGDVVPNSNDLVSYQLGDFADVDAFVEAVILERRVELAFEGNYFHDLTRLQRNIKGVPYDDPTLRFPIPQRDLDANQNLVQNTGY